MPSCRPLSGARSRRLLFALVALAFVGGNPRIEGDDSPAANDGALVEVNGSQRSPPQTKRTEVQIDLGDRKDATAEIVRERGKPNVEINGYRLRSGPRTARH